MPVIDKDDNAAKRVARAIVSDIVIYNKAKIEDGVRNDTLFDVLKETVDEGRTLYQSRVSPELFRKNYYGRALVDKLLKPNAHWAIWAVLLASAAFALWAERTRWGSRLSGAVIAIGPAFVLSNLRVIPAVLVGTLAYAIANFVGVAVATFLR
mgnify:CR=1 FL=1